MGPVAEAGPSKDPVLTSKGRPRRKRVRTVTGCLLCRQRRVKCDEQRVSAESSRPHWSLTDLSRGVQTVKDIPTGYASTNSSLSPIAHRLPQSTCR